MDDHGCGFPEDMPPAARKAMQKTVAQTWAAMEEAKKKGDPICITLHTDEEGDVIVAADTKEQVERLAVTTNGKIKATVLCKHCKNLPCLADHWYDHICQWGQEMEEDSSANGNFGGFDNKTIRFTIYQNLVREIYGTLGKRIRKQLPQCVVAEIHDLYPAKKGTKYTGFKEADSDVKSPSPPTP